MRLSLALNLVNVFKLTQDTFYTSALTGRKQVVTSFSFLCVATAHLAHLAIGRPLNGVYKLTVITFSHLSPSVVMLNSLNFRMKAHQAINVFCIAFKVA